jgi:hypothetical protein
MIGTIKDEKEKRRIESHVNAGGRFPPSIETTPNENRRGMTNPN